MTPRAPIGDTAQVLAFADYARVSDKHTQPKTPKHIALASIGLGFNYVLGRHLNLHADYGWQLNTAPGATSRSGRANFVITLSY